MYRGADGGEGFGEGMPELALDMSNGVWSSSSSEEEESLLLPYSSLCHVVWCLDT